MELRKIENDIYTKLAFYEKKIQLFQQQSKKIAPNDKQCDKLVKF